MQPRLAQLRAERGLSQLQVADLLGVTDQTVSRWERGVMVPRQYFFSGINWLTTQLQRLAVVPIQATH